MLLRIISILLPVLSIVLIGYLYGRRHAPDMVTVNRINMDLFVPALVFVALAGKDVQLAQYGWLALGAAGVVLGSGLLAWPLARLLGIAPLTFVPPMMFNNSGNMGLPLIVLAFGAVALPGAVILFLVEMILHFSLGLWLMDRHAPIGRLFRQPVMLATAAGLLVSLSGWALPDALALGLKMLGDVSVPLLLFSLGVRIAGVSWAEWKLGVLGGLVCPASGLLMVALMQPVLPLPANQQAWLWLFAALPPAVLNFLVAEQYRQEPSRVASLVLIGNLMSLLVLPPVLYGLLS